MQRMLFRLAVISSLMPSLAFADKPNRNRNGKKLTSATLVLLAILAALFTGTGIKNALSPNGSHDFQWTPAKDVVDGVNPYRDFTAWKAQSKASVPPHFLNHSPSYPASTYIILSPFAHLDWETAKLAWLAANLVFTVLLFLGMRKVFPVKNSTILALLVLSFLIASPLRRSLGAGQHNLISLAAFIWAYYFTLNGNNKILSGILLSVAWIKYSLTFPLSLIFLQRGGVKPILIATGIHCVLTCIAAWRIGMLPHEFFFDSVQVVLMGDSTGFLNLVALSMNLDLALPVPLTIIAIATIAVACAVYHYRDADPLLVMAFLGLFSCAVFYHHGYDFIVLLMCAWALANERIQGAASTATACLLAIAWVGQWLASELSLYTGTNIAIAADYLLVSVFYCTLFLLAKQIFVRRAKLGAVTTVAF